MVLSERIELSASSLPRTRSTTELRQHLLATGFSLTKGMSVAQTVYVKHRPTPNHHCWIRSVSTPTTLPLRQGVTWHTCDTRFGVAKTPVAFRIHPRRYAHEG